MYNLLNWLKPAGKIQKIFLMMSLATVVVIVFLHNPTEGYIIQFFDHQIHSKLKIDQESNRLYRVEEVGGLVTKELDLGNVLDYWEWSFFSKGAMISWLASLKNFVFTLFCVFLIYLIPKCINFDDEINE